MARLRFKRGQHVSTIIPKLLRTVLSLYVGGTVLTELGNIARFTESGMWPGLRVIGWTVGNWPLYNSTHYATSCANTTLGALTTDSHTTCITATTGSGILSIVGIIGIAYIITNFVSF